MNRPSASTPGALAATIERLAFRAWPAAEEREVAGWMARFTPGVRNRRVNSATSPLVDLADHEAALDAIAVWYRERSARCVYRLLSPSPAASDQLLAGRGWAADPATAVMVAEIGARPMPDGAAVTPAPDDGWIGTKRRVLGLGADEEAAWREAVDRVEPPAGFVSVTAGGEVVAYGFTVVDGGWAGLFDLMVVPERRREGHGAKLVAALLAWAADRGAERSYLQVMADNGPALVLYERFGYEVGYRYWYRRAP